MILDRVGPVAYTLQLPEELSNVHSTFYVSNLKKCLSDESLVILMKELRLNDKLNFMEEPIEIMDREVKQLKQSRMAYPGYAERVWVIAVWNEAGAAAWGSNVAKKASTIISVNYLWVRTVQLLVRGVEGTLVIEQPMAQSGIGLEGVQTCYHSNFMFSMYFGNSVVKL
ncbi:hypothetical protein Tco_1310498 [Tanacetum coccineum]